MIQNHSKIEQKVLLTLFSRCPLLPTVPLASQLKLSAIIMGLRCFYSEYSWLENRKHLRGATLKVCRQGLEELRCNAHQCLSGETPMPLSEVSLSPFFEHSAATDLPLLLLLIGNGIPTSYGVNQNTWMPGSLSLHPQTILPWLLPSLLLDSSQLCEEHFLEQSFLSACHWICFLFHLPDLIPTEDTILMVKKRTAATAHWVKYLEALWSLGCSITSMFKLQPKPPPSCRACALKQ